MPKPDYRGARGANAGDDFHEMWALREALGLLIPETTLTTVTVEGVHPDDAAGTAADTWDGVDCTYYFGGQSTATATDIRCDQVKYSSADPMAAWTVSRLTSAPTQKKAPRSVLRRLGQAFEDIASKRPDLVDANRVRMRLVSNQPVAADVLAAVAEQELVPTTKRGRASRSVSPVRAALAKASGVSAALQPAFFGALELSPSGVGSRLAAETRLLKEVASWTETEARPVLTELLRQVRRLMMPEGAHELITRSDLLAWMNVSHEAALFPCPSALSPSPEHRVPRTAVHEVVEAFARNSQRVCLHGGGGVGKTTALVEIESLLPAGSHLVTFDCYGGGRYLDAESLRHRAPEAFLQLANDMAARLRLPLLVSQSATVAMFARRLFLAAEALSATTPGALLVLAVDAADNSVHAAMHQAPPERSFVLDLAQIGALPPNVRLLISTRTSRREALRLGAHFVHIELLPFALPETEHVVRAEWPASSASWCNDFHRLSAGNPRVQAYAFARADAALHGASSDAALDRSAAARAARAMDALMPAGKDLDAVFALQLEEAARKAGGLTDLTQMAQGLMALPRPVPIAHLASLVMRSPAQVLEFCADLAPGLRVTNHEVSFADEDFEAFVRSKADALDPMAGRIADILVAVRHTDAYAARHVGGALLAAGRRPEVIALGQDDDPLLSIADPVGRREIRLQRLRLAMRVCREAGDVGDAIFTVVRGAAAVQTNHAIRDAFVQYPDLAVRFAADSMSRTVLQRADEWACHGRLLLHRECADAERGDSLGVREGHKRVLAWFRAGTTATERTATHSGAASGEIEDIDIAAHIEATLRLYGPSAALREMNRWSPRSSALAVLHAVSTRLASGDERDHALLAALVGEPRLAPWSIIARVPLALSGGPFNARAAEVSLAQLRRHDLLRTVTQSAADRARADLLLDAAMSACELCVAHGLPPASVRAVVQSMAEPVRTAPDISDATTLDRCLRAHALLAAWDGQPLTTDRLVPLTDDAAPDKSAAVNASDRRGRAEARWHQERERERRRFIDPFVPLYEARAGVLLGKLAAGEPEPLLQRGVERLVHDAYQLRGPYGRNMRGKAAASILVLLGVASLDRATLWEQAQTVGDFSTSLFGEQEVEAWTRASAERALHATLVGAASAYATRIARAQTVSVDQINAFARLARVMCPVSREDARALFAAALKAAEHVDPEFTHLVSLAAAMAPRAAPSLDRGARRDLAVAFAVVAEDAAIRLRGYDHYPWNAVVYALTEWDVPCALAAVGRWHDRAVADLDDTLPVVLSAALDQQVLTPETVLALQPLCGALSHELADDILAAAQRPAANANVMPRDRMRRIAEALSRTTLSAQDHDSASADALVWQAIEQRGVAVDDAPWTDALRASVVADERAAPPPHFTEAQPTFADADRGAEVEAALDGDDDGATAATTAAGGAPSSASGDPRYALGHFVSATFDLSTTEGVWAALRANRDQATADLSVTPGIVLAAARKRVLPGQRVAYLNAVVALWARDEVMPETVTEEVLGAVAGWSDSLAVGDWLAALIDRLPDVLPALVRNYPHTSSLRRLCRAIRSGGRPASATSGQGVVSDDAQRAHRLRDALLLGLEQHVDALTPAAIYSVAEEIVASAAPPEVVRAARLTMTWLAGRVEPAFRAPWAVTDVPESPSGAVGRLLFALLGDAETPRRWRAAHAVRQLAQLGDEASLGATVAEYDRRTELSFADGTAPFYWHASRLWLMVALARVADETPHAAMPFAAFLVSAGTDPAFPHLLLRWFARAGARALAAAGGAVSADDLTELDVAVGYGRPRASRTKARIREQMVERASQPHWSPVAQRFRFDMMDTVPYWFKPAVRAFANVDLATFEAEASGWILDRWAVPPFPRAWAQEPRARRFGNGMDTMHRHGELPTHWRFATHLEWHAMWCALGSLMPSHTLRRAVKGDTYGSLARMLRDAALTHAPFWQADMRGPRPRERWLNPTMAQTAAQSDTVTEHEFRARAGLTASSNWITVAMSAGVSGRSYGDSTELRTALVTPAHARSLIRALQTADDSHNFRLPDAGDEFEIRTAGRRLVGWLKPRRDGSGIDGDDPYRRSSRGVPVMVRRHLAERLGLRFVVDPFPRWIDAMGVTALRYDVWSGPSSGERRNYVGTTESGWRLQISRPMLQAVLDVTALDLIMDIGVTLRTGVYESQRFHEEDPPRDTSYSRLFLLQRDGEFAAAEGPLGAWTPHCP